MEQRKLEEIKRKVENAKEVGLTGVNLASAVYDEYCKVVPELLEEINRLTIDNTNKIQKWKADCEKSIKAVHESYDGFINELSKKMSKLEAELAEYKKAKDDGRLIVLPCKAGDTVYTIDEIYHPCSKCEEMGRTDLEACYKASTTAPFTEAKYECPTAYEINEHTVEGYEINYDGLSLAGEFGWEGLQQFYGCDKKQYYSREEAEAALKEGLSE